MITIQARVMSDDKWKSVAKFEDLSKKEINPKQWDGKATDWKALRDDTLNSPKVSEIPFSNIYYLFDENNTVSCIEAFERRGNLYLEYSYQEKIITKNILKSIYKIMDERNKDEAFYSTFNERQYLAIIETGAEVFEELMYSRLLKKDIDFSKLQIIIDSNKIAQSYELKLFHNIPEEIYDRFVNYMNEVIIDSNFFHPKKKVINEYTMSDLLERVNDIKEDRCPFYMYMLFDNNNIAGHCSAFVGMTDNIHWIDHIGAGFTSAGRNYRGKNLAKYLKAKMYMKIQEDYPDFQYIMTDTFPWNKYMYRINEQMGFTPFMKEYNFRFTKEHLGKI